MLFESRYGFLALASKTRITDGYKGVVQGIVGGTVGIEPLTWPIVTGKLTTFMPALFLLLPGARRLIEVQDPVTANLVGINRFRFLPIVGMLVCRTAIQLWARFRAWLFVVIFDGQHQLGKRHEPLLLGVLFDVSL